LLPSLATNSKDRFGQEVDIYDHPAMTPDTSLSGRQIDDNACMTDKSITNGKASLASAGLNVKFIEYCQSTVAVKRTATRMIATTGHPDFNASRRRTKANRRNWFS
jgi:hypothetical protein